MKVAYFQCQSGASGDMMLGALVDAGLPLATLQSLLGALPLRGYELTARQVTRGGLRGTKVDVLVTEEEGAPGGHEHPGDGHHHNHARNLGDIEDLLNRSKLSPRAKERARAAFRRLAEAEARAHGCAIEEVHFHEVGAVDSIVDTVGTIVGLEAMGIERVYASPLNVGEGTVETAHGLLPVPAPATAALLAGVPIYSSGIRAELVTPTAAALLTTLSTGFGPLPGMRVQAVGYGAGSRDLVEQPNLLRLLVGEMGGTGDVQADEVAVIEANIDDMNPQDYELLAERLFAAGALDVTLVPLYMKKFRPGTRVSVVAPSGSEQQVADVLLRDSTTLGVRISHWQRKTAERRQTSVQTRYGLVAIKIATYGGTRRAMPEYEDCAKLARQCGVSVDEVREAARAAFEQLR